MHSALSLDDDHRVDVRDAGSSYLRTARTRSVACLRTHVSVGPEKINTFESAPNPPLVLALLVCNDQLERQATAGEPDRRHWQAVLQDHEKTLTDMLDGQHVAITAFRFHLRRGSTVTTPRSEIRRASK